MLLCVEYEAFGWDLDQTVNFKKTFYLCTVSLKFIYNKYNSVKYNFGFSIYCLTILHNNKSKVFSGK